MTQNTTTPDLIERDHRSFPEAADGRPFPPMMDELMTAGLNGEDARFVAIQLAQNGLMLVPAMDAMMAAGLLDTVRRCALDLYGENQTYPCDDVKRLATDARKAAAQDVAEVEALLTENERLGNLFDDLCYFGTGSGAANELARRATSAEAERDALKAEVERKDAEIARLNYVLDGVAGAIDTGRNEPLVIWREQINIARDALRAHEQGEG